VGPDVALAHVAAELAQPAGLLVGLDALGHDRDAHPVGERDHGPDDADVRVAHIEIGHE
jgi:hypothetical protein